MLANLDEHLCLVLVLPAERTIARASIIASWWKWGTVFPSCLLPSPSSLPFPGPEKSPPWQQRTELAYERASRRIFHLCIYLPPPQPRQTGGQTDRRIHRQVALGKGGCHTRARARVVVRNYCVSPSLSCYLSWL